MALTGFDSLTAIDVTLGSKFKTGGNGLYDDNTPPLKLRLYQDGTTANFYESSSSQDADRTNNRIKVSFSQSAGRYQRAYLCLNGTPDTFPAGATNVVGQMGGFTGGNYTFLDMMRAADGWTGTGTLGPITAYCNTIAVCTLRPRPNGSTYGSSAAYYSISYADPGTVFGKYLTKIFTTMEEAVPTPAPTLQDKTNYVFV